MEKLKPKDLRKSMKWLLELATCPICLSTLQCDTVQCVNGHPICVECRQGLEICPTCRDQFSNVRPSGFINQVIQSLPHPCRYPDCTKFVKTNDNHEQFCGYKTTECKHCNWTGPAHGIVAHLQIVHHQLLPVKQTQKKWGKQFNHREECSVFYPILVKGEFFWGEMKNDIQSDKLTAVVHHVPNGKTDSIYFSHVLLKLKKEKYTASLKLNINPTADPYKDNCITIPTSLLHKFTDENKLFYKLFVTKNKWESFKNILEIWIDDMKNLIHLK